MTGNSLLDMLLLAIPIAMGGLWWTGSRARELAIEHARNTCRREQLQFLDQTVALERLRPDRNAGGAFCFRREYRFEFTDQGQHRDQGSVSMRGHTLLRVYIPYSRDADGNRVFLH